MFQVSIYSDSRLIGQKYTKSLIHVYAMSILHTHKISIVYLKYIIRNSFIPINICQDLQYNLELYILIFLVFISVN